MLSDPDACVAERILPVMTTRARERLRHMNCSPGRYFLSAHQWRLPQEGVFIDPIAQMGERSLPVMLKPPLPENENSPLATTAGGAGIRLGALTMKQFSPGRHTEHETLTTMLSRMVNRRRAPESEGTSTCKRAHPCQSPLTSNVAGEAYVNTPLPVRPYRSVRITSTVPAAWAGICKEMPSSGPQIVSKVLTMPSTVTVTADPVPVPLMTTGAPPAVDPVFGTNSLMVGGGMTAYRYPPGTLRLCAIGDPRDTVTSTLPAA